jgi:hypothetical protein
MNNFYNDEPSGEAMMLANTMPSPVGDWLFITEKPNSNGCWQPSDSEFVDIQCSTAPIFDVSLITVCSLLANS